MATLTVEHLSKRFDGRPVLSDVSLEARPGDIVALIGPSGCGKTTLLRCILGELRPDAGKILLDGKDVSRRPVEKREVGIVYQRYALFPHLSVADNIGYGLRIRKEPVDKIRGRVTQLLDMVRLSGKGGQYPERLSGGERQRVALARALAVEPRVLLLDEAFTALDANTRHAVIEEVRAIIKRLELPTVLVTHDQEEAFLFSTKVVVLNEGKVVVQGPPETVMAHPDPFIERFVKMAVFHKGTVEENHRGQLFVPLETGGRIPIDMPNIKPGDVVQVVVKKTGESETIEVWRHGTG